jgi:hypothetical protein
MTRQPSSGRPVDPQPTAPANIPQEPDAPQQADMLGATDPFDDFDDDDFDDEFDDDFEEEWDEELPGDADQFPDDDEEEGGDGGTVTVEPDFEDED